MQPLAGGFLARVIFVYLSFFYNEKFLLLLQLLLNLRPSRGPSLPFLCKSLLLWNLFPCDTVNQISSPYSPLSNKPPPTLSGEESYRKPPSLYYRPPSPFPPNYSSPINERLYQSITTVNDCKTLCGLIQDGLFTNWKFGFDSDPRLHDLQPSCSWASPLCILVLYGELIPLSFLN